jgi:hypothetical protein
VKQQRALDAWLVPSRLRAPLAAAVVPIPCTSDYTRATPARTADTRHATRSPALQHGAIAIALTRGTSARWSLAHPYPRDAGGSRSSPDSLRCSQQRGARQGRGFARRCHRHRLGPCCHAEGGLVFCNTSWAQDAHAGPSACRKGADHGETVPKLVPRCDIRHDLHKGPKDGRPSLLLSLEGTNGADLTCARRQGGSL